MSSEGSTCSETSPGSPPSTSGTPTPIPEYVKGSNQHHDTETQALMLAEYATIKAARDGKRGVVAELCREYNAGMKYFAQLKARGRVIREKTVAEPYKLAPIKAKKLAEIAKAMSTM